MCGLVGEAGSKTGVPRDAVESASGSLLRLGSSAFDDLGREAFTSFSTALDGKDFREI